MTINLIASVVTYKNKLAIGYNDDLLVKIKQDLDFFKNTTQNSIVVMGRKTFYSIPENYRPLRNRYNFVLTNDLNLLNKNDFSEQITFENLDKEKTYFMTFETFENFCHDLNQRLDVFIIGGGKIYSKFLTTKNKNIIPKNLYITQISGFVFKDKNCDKITFMDNFNYKYKLIGYSEKFKKDNNISARILHYKHYDDYFYNFKYEEYKYLNLVKDILKKGNQRPDRTGTGTFSLFGKQMRFNISNGNLPLLTTKQISFKSIVEELLFFCRGETDSSILDKKGVKIWNANTTREFLDMRNLKDYPIGSMGPMYGWSWRHFGADYSQRFNNSIGGFDQLKNVEHLLKTEPFSRRIYISNLNPAESSKMCLDMCHTYIQFYVEEIKGIKYLSGFFTMRSSDFLAWSYNICSYTILLNILALKCNMKPKEIVYNAVDCHVYTNHVEGINLQLSRIPRPIPKINIDKDLKNKDWNDMNFSDFELIGYFPHPYIKAEMSI